MNSKECIFLVVFLVLLQNSQGAPNTRNDNVLSWETVPTNSDGIKQIDDMLFPASTKAGLIDERYRWPDRIVVYDLTTNFSTSYLPKISENPA